MHSYLLCGIDRKMIDNTLYSIQNKLKAKIFEFRIEKIEHVRELSSITKLKTNVKTIILIRNIEKATTEALNAYLKNLEEPNPNITFLLTASSVHKVLPTIVSRCQIINLQSKSYLEGNSKANIDKFLNLNTSDKLNYINSIKKKQEAIVFIQDLIFLAHQKLIEEKASYSGLIKILKNAQKTFTNLNANGNVNLQLTNFVLSL